MKITIKNLKGDVFNVELDESQTFLDIKTQIASTRSVSIQSQKLVYKGKVMDDKMIIGQIGIRQGEFIVLMNTVHKKKQGTSAILNVENGLHPKKQEINGKKEESNIAQKSNKPQVLFGLKKEKDQKQEKEPPKELSALNDSINNDNLQLLINSVISSGGNVKIQCSDKMVSNLVAQNPELSNLVNQNPSILQQILLSGVHYQQEGSIDEDYEGESEIEGIIGANQQIQMQLTQAQNEAIIRLQNLGFMREDVIETYFACDKNEQIAANMLFDRKENGEFQNQNIEGAENDDDNLFQ